MAAVRVAGHVMTEASTAHVFIDANTALHFKRPDQIDWRALTGTDKVILVAAPILHRELEQQKVHNPSRRLRERANSYVKWLATFVRTPKLEIRAGTFWHFVPLEPQLDFGAHNLSPSIADDQLIASVIVYAAETTDPIFVATADVGLEVKLRHRRIAPLLLPDDLRLPEEPDAQEKEILSLRRQVAQQRVPVLTLVTGKDGGRYAFPKVSEVTVPSAPSLAEMRRQHRPLVDERSTPAAGEDTVSRLTRLASFQTLWLTPERIASFNRELEEFFSQYTTFREALLIWEQQAALTVEVTLSLCNEGTAPASDVDLILQFPEDIILMTRDDLPARPDEPKPPRRPETGIGSMISMPDMAPFMQPHWQRQLLNPNIHSSTTVSTDDGQVRFWLKNLKHGFSEEFEHVYFRFPDSQAVRSFNVGYKISAAELPQEVVGRIHFVLT